MTRRIFRSICVVALAVFVGSMALVMDLLYGYFSSEQMRQLRQQAHLVAQGVSDEGMDFFDGLDMDGTRVTWIAGDGEVLYDNEANAGAMDNHLGREEIQQVLKLGEGESTRYSDTLTERQMYVALPLQDGSIVRVSDAQYTILTLLVSLSQPILIVIALGLALSLWLASRLARRIVQPLNGMKLDPPDETAVYPELAPLMDRLRYQQNQLTIQRAELKRRQHEMEAATGSMQEGVILLDENGCVMSLNPAAQRILNVTDYCIGKDFMLFNHSCELQNVLRQAQKGERAQETLTFGGVRYQLNASPVESDGKRVGTVLTLFDVTEKLKNEQLRREFTANVSHELKTPLQGIIGSAELIEKGMVDSKDVPRFIGHIRTEATRMVALISDIIRLSQLDEGVEMPRENVELTALAEEVADSLTPAAARRKIALHAEGQPVSVFGVRRLLYEVLYNLCDNAIKYNVEGGQVDVHVSAEDGMACVEVSDTGIGIPKADQSRIFERFYRVDKSHSKASGGTGLGLSIVKHAVQYHHGKIELQSELCHGTTVRVRLPFNG